MKYFLILLIAFVFVSCSEEEPQRLEHSWGKMKGLEKLVGNMSDTSYSSVRNFPPRLNALGEAVAIESYEGKFLWAEYAASWCKTCVKQTVQMKQVKAGFSPEVNFITVMTGKSTSYNDHADLATAKQWSAQHQLDPRHVFSAQLWYKTVPEHRLFSPEGHTLFVHVGYLSSDEIADILRRYRRDWQNYRDLGIYADWMY